MKLKIHRGTGQIGGNIIEIATDRTKIILDCGRNLPPLDQPKEDDDFELDGLTRGQSVYDAVFITHYYADHCGLVERVNADIPIYMSSETKTVLNIIADFIDAPPVRCNHVLDAGNEVVVGDIEVLPLEVKHSAKGALAFLVKAGGNKLLYTGDFKDMNSAYYSLIGKIDILLCEGTNIGARNGITEKDVESEAARIMRETAGQVFVLCSTANIDRIKAIENACRSSGRTIAIDPFMDAIINNIGRVLLVNPVGFVPHFIREENSPRAHKHFFDDIHNFAGADAISKMTNLTFMVRQTMGDFLKRLDKAAPLKGSALIYSMWRGYENVGKTKEFLDLCRRLGMNIEYLHASGHAYREQLETTVLRLNPAGIVPIRTDNANEFYELHDGIINLRDGEVLDCTKVRRYETWRLTT